MCLKVRNNVTNFVVNLAQFNNVKVIRYFLMHLTVDLIAEKNENKIILKHILLI